MFGFSKKQINLKYEDPKPTSKEMPTSELLASRLTQQGEILLNDHIVKKSTKMVIENVEVYFPFKPYDVQVDYMGSVIKTLSEKHNALLQSPTGTGKTLSILCATLAWLRKRRQEDFSQNNDPNKAQAQNVKIIYASRTHSQLKQVIKELKTTVFQPKLCVLGSRDQQCIKPEFRTLKGYQLNQACQKAISGKQKTQFAQQIDNEGSCQFFSKDHILWLAGQHNREIMDIEDVKAFGRRNKVCPYFFERQRKEIADIIFMPYNYLLEHQFSDIVDVQNSIIIFDEAHNVAGVAEEGSSFSLSSTQLDEADKELNRWIDLCKTDGNLLSRSLKNKGFDQSEVSCGINVPTLTNIHQTMKCFAQYMLALRQDKRFVINNQQTNDKGFILDGTDIFKLIFTYTKDNSGCFTQFTNNKEGLFLGGIDEKSFNRYVEVGYVFMEQMQEIAPAYHFEAWMRFIKVVNQLFNQHITFNPLNDSKIHWIDNPINHYKLSISLDERDNIVLNMWCLDPGQAFQRLQNKGVHSIILTSGTLSPFSSWESELKIPFQIQQSCGHVIDIQKNLIAGIVQRGQNGCEFNFGFQNRQNNQIYDELGLMLINMSSHIPNGILVIFSSYSLMNKCKFVWSDKEKQILIRLHQKKPCFWEPTFANELVDIFQQYEAAAKKERGAIMFAVCRGKIAEGIDFSDELCRAVFVVGIPFPPYQDPKILLKKAQIDKLYNDSSLNRFKKINSKEWYNQQAIRSTNQALGRVIRHIDDYGAIFLCDLRFEWKYLKNDVSSWVQPVLKSWTSFSESYKCSNDFFATKKVIITNSALVNEVMDEIKNSEIQPKKRHHTFQFGLNQKYKAEIMQDISELQKKQINHDI